MKSRRVDGLMVMSEEVVVVGEKEVGCGEADSSCWLGWHMRPSLPCSIWQMTKSHIRHIIVLITGLQGISMLKSHSCLQKKPVLDNNCYAPTTPKDEQRASREDSQRTLSDGETADTAKPIMVDN